MAREDRLLPDLEDWRKPCGKLRTCWGCPRHDFHPQLGHYCHVWGKVEGMNNATCDTGLKGETHEFCKE